MVDPDATEKISEIMSIYKKEAILSRRMQSFENGLIGINEKLKKKGTQKKYKKIIERIDRLKERYQVSNLYNIKIEKENQNASNVKFSKNPKGKTREETVDDLSVFLVEVGLINTTSKLVVC